MASVRGCLHRNSKAFCAGRPALASSQRSLCIASQSQRLHVPQPLSSLRPTRAYSSSPLGTISQGSSSPSSTLQSLSAPSHLDSNESEIFNLLNTSLHPSKLEVKDISGGCGSMYGIEIESEQFKGLGILKQQRLVNGVLKEKMDREGWHGVQIRTKVPGQ